MGEVKRECGDKEECWERERERRLKYAKGENVGEERRRGGDEGQCGKREKDVLSMLS